MKVVICTTDSTKVLKASLSLGGIQQLRDQIYSNFEDLDENYINPSENPNQNFVATLENSGIRLSSNKPALRNQTVANLTITVVHLVKMMLLDAI